MTVTVEDEGSGLTEDALEHLFEPFFTTKPQGQGSGLGLATVYGIMQQANGAITVDERERGGARFTAYWPRATGPAATAGDAAARAYTEAVSRPDTRTLLLVDDEDAIRRTVSRLLMRAGYRVLVAASGIEAMALLREHGASVDAIITDVRMPGQSGVELVTTLVESGIDLPVLFVSGQLEAALPTTWPRTAPRHFLRKPFTLDELLRETERLFGSA
jgi:CheY-like chemotaxis protein